MSRHSIVHDIDPQMREAVERNLSIAGRNKAMADTPVEELRRLYLAERRAWNAERPELAAVHNETIEGSAGSIPLRLYRPEPDATLPVLIYFHGGGWIVGNIDTHDRIMRLLARKSGWAVLGVDYRLAPEHKFPTQIEEALAVSRALPERAKAWGIAPERSVLSGDSAGAQIALASALELRDAGAHLPAGLALFYGAFGLRDSRSRRLLGGEFFGLSARDMDFYSAALLRDAADASDPRFELVAAELSGLPPTHLCAAGLDPLLDDSLVMAERLESAGVATALKVYPGMLHGFLHYSAQVARAMQALDDAAAWLRALD